MIREATLDDVPRILEMAEHFVAGSEYAEKIALDSLHVTNLAGWLIESATGAVLVAEEHGALVGMLALTVFAHPMSGQRMASEFVWWVEPESRGSLGVRLLKAAEAWAAAQGAAVLQMVAPNARLAAFYEAAGYTSVETSYQRSV